MDNATRKLLVEQQTEKSRKFLAQAEEMFRLNHWDITANRCYYSCFHAVQGLFISKGIVGHTHAGTISQFNLHFIKTGLIELRHGSFLSRMMQLRQKADYNCSYEISKNDVEDLIKLTSEFVDAVTKLTIQNTEKL